MVEMAAAAYVQMKHGDYKYPDGSRKGRLQEDGSRINKRELMRIAGYKTEDTNTHYERLEEQEYYQDMIALYEKRYSDPLFQDENVGRLWETIGNDALRNIYERLNYAPHELSLEQLVKVVNMVVNAGLTLKKIGDTEESKAKNLMNRIKDPEMRQEVKNDYKKRLLMELEELEKDM